MSFCEQIDVQIGPKSYVSIEFHNDMLALLHRPFLTRAEMPSDVDQHYLIMVHGGYRSPEPTPGVLEAWGDGFLFRFDPRTTTGHAWLWGEIPAWQRACPVRQLLAWIVAHSGGVLLHAAATHIPGVGAVLITGPSGAGKSTLVAQFLEDCYIGDDWVVVRQLPGYRSWGAFSVYKTLKLSSSTSEWVCLPNLARYKSMSDDKKTIFVLPAAGGGFEIARIILPAVRKQGITLLPATSFDALEAAAPTTLLQSSGVPPTVLSTIRKMCAELPVSELGVSGEYLPIARDLLIAALRKTFE